MNKTWTCIAIGALIGCLGMLMLSASLDGIYFVKGEEKTDLTPTWSIVAAAVGGCFGLVASTKI